MVLRVLQTRRRTRKTRVYRARIYSIYCHIGQNIIKYMYRRDSGKKWLCFKYIITYNKLIQNCDKNTRDHRVVVKNNIL